MCMSSGITDVHNVVVNKGDYMHIFNVMHRKNPLYKFGVRSCKILCLTKNFVSLLDNERAGYSGEEVVIVGSEHVEDIDLGVNSNFGVFKQSLEGADFHTIIRFIEGMMEKRMIVSSTKLLLIMPFFYNLIKKCGTEEEKRTILKTVRQKLKKWKARHPGLCKVVWVLPYKVDFEKYKLDLNAPAKNVNELSSKYHNGLNFIRNELEMSHAAIFDPSTMADTSLAENGYTLSSEASKCFSEKIQELIKYSSLRDSRSSRYKKGKDV